MSGNKYQSLSRDKMCIALTPRDAKNASPKPSRSSVRLSVNESKVTTQYEEFATSPGSDQ